MIIFISGGARSGKSSFAEKLAITTYVKKGTRLVYLATANKSDEEMTQRIQIHQQIRGNIWDLVEEPCDVARVLHLCKNGDVILLDCLTIWLSNVMFGEADFDLEECLECVHEWKRIAAEKELTLFIVSNDVNEDLPSPYELVRNYIIQLEKLHRFLVEHSNEVIQVRAGLPKYWKGRGIHK
ncbi:bifunctional adenosylcobinamide kinase/adenosylcobinamide-phosphate guanylyltransferase [Sutcliffiella rhizosphaerae]|uniref:Adenosylcobinamide kinase n=1 Tax=Sutcliffiella rhizosphaerae TaxID=2880967 RepID=A0ABM8YJY7_9BACI|nr:bifunctional adenosylcobinamide kinase/adenosylcobinamide-phosphate guanylyltransferase [Sutcliffiella rhizosphaerae]CAG9620231.1 Bifunctional adenosylcobalamin biosynthesis protein CobP [Sutcliffiella rhizosphaerae]